MRGVATLSVLLAAGIGTAGWFLLSRSAAMPDPMTQVAEQSDARDGSAIQSATRGRVEEAVTRSDGDSEWDAFPRADTVVPAVSRIPGLFGPRDTYRDRSLNPRDTYLVRSQRAKIQALVEEFAPRIRDADRAAAAAVAEAATLRAAVDAVELTGEELSQVKQSATRAYKTMQTLMGADGSADGSAAAPGPTLAAMIERNEMNLKSAKLAHAKGIDPGALAPDAQSVEAVRLRELSVSLRCELLRRLSEEFSAAGVLTREEATSLVAACEDKLQRSGRR